MKFFPLILSILFVIPGGSLSALVTLNQQEIVQAALEGRIDVVKNATDVGYPVDTKDAEGRTLLMYAAFNGHVKIAEYLILKGADVNALDKGGSTALMFAASGPSADTVRLLLENKADVNVVDTGGGFNALMWASAEGQKENVLLLLKHGADPTHIDADGDTAMAFAEQKGFTEIMQILALALQQGASPTVGETLPVDAKSE